MNLARHILLSLIVVVSTLNIYAVDYKVDTSFQADVPGLDSVLDMVVLPDGKLVIVGFFQQVNGTQRQYIARLNPDGSVDPTFTSPFGSPPSSEGPGVIETINLLPDGKYLVGGRFHVGTTYSEYARLNTDGTVDTSMTVGTLNNWPAPGSDIQPLADGKFLMCGSRDDDDPFSLVYKFNADGTRDTAFQSSFASGFCRRILSLPDGKVITYGWYLINGVEIKSFHRLNPDGSKDNTFDAYMPPGSTPIDFVSLPDGKLRVYYGAQPTGWITTLNPDGSLYYQYPVRCGGRGLLDNGDGTFLTSGCTRSPSNPMFYYFARVLADGAIDPTFDWLPFTSGEIEGIQRGPGGSIYLHGRFTMSNSKFNRRNIARLVPNNDTLKAKFDFDGDGRSDLAVFRPADRTWYINRSTDGAYYFQWGLATDKLAATHYDGDGKTDIGVYRDGTWYEVGSLSGYRQWTGGQAGDKPMFGEFGAWGAERTLLRGIRSGSVRWVSPSSQIGAQSVPGEQLSDIPVLGDFEGDGRESPGYFRDGLWYGGHSNPLTPAEPAIHWGTAGDIPVPADYDGDRVTDYAVFRPSTGVWWIRLSSDSNFIVGWGLNGDIPVPADYDGDGKTDIAVYRNGVWWQYRMGSGTMHVEAWGGAGDIPIPAQNQFN